MSTRQRGAGERGSVTLVAAGMLVVLLVLVLGSADVAKTLAAVGRAQTAADAAALAAAQEQVAPTGPGPEALAGQYAEWNGATLESCRCPPDGTDAVVAVTVQVGRLLFLRQIDHVTTTARAVVDLGGG
jgi:secretion/DNA translocation related TadE-like protein